MYFFTADEHYGHTNIIDYCNRPFDNVHEMDKALIDNHNLVVKNSDIVIHAGDFTMNRKYGYVLQRYVNVLNGNHIFLKGSHDRWLKGKDAPQIYELKIVKTLIVVCHYAMRTWAKSHYNSWHLFGHSHGRLDPIGKSWDIGVDNNHFFPVSYYDIKNIMAQRPDNPNLIRKSR